MIYLYIAAAIAFAGLGAYAKIEHSRADAAQAQVAERDAKIEQQNAAIKATKEEGDRRVAAASQGVVRATKETAAARTEAERLKTLSAAPTPAGACPAGAAMAEIRKGLK